jgi:hypothetical protein
MRHYGPYLLGLPLTVFESVLRSSGAGRGLASTSKIHLNPPPARFSINVTQSKNVEAKPDKTISVERHRRTGTVCANRTSGSQYQLLTDELDSSEIVYKETPID